MPYFHKSVAEEVAVIRCDNEKEFIELMLHIFFSEDRAKLSYDEVVCMEYKLVQSCLGIAQKEHDEADRLMQDVEIDLLEEFLKGNHKFSNQQYPMYVEWDFRRWGCESENSIHYFQTFSYSDLSWNTLKDIQTAANEEHNYHKSLWQKYQQLITEGKK